MRGLGLAQPRHPASGSRGQPQAGEHLSASQGHPPREAAGWWQLLAPALSKPRLWIHMEMPQSYEEKRPQPSPAPPSPRAQRRPAA